MIAPLVSALLIGAAPPAVVREAETATVALQRYMPCTVGLTIEYEILPVENAVKTARRARMIETIRGPGKEPSTCVIDRRTIRPEGTEVKEAWAREHLPDRITNAGFVDRPVAFRTPLLKAPIKRGQRWRFNTTEFEIREVGDTFDVPAGTFDGCVRVVERSKDGKHQAHSVYAPGVGLIIYESLEMRMRASRVTKAESSKTSR